MMTVTGFLPQRMVSIEVAQTEYMVVVSGLDDGVIGF